MFGTSTFRLKVRAKRSARIMLCSEEVSSAAGTPLPQTSPIARPRFPSFISK